MCGPRQVPNCRVALQHNIGLGGAAVVGVYRLGFPNARRPSPPAAEANPAICANACSAYVPHLHGVSMSSTSASYRPTPSPVSGFESDKLFAELQAGLKENADLAQTAAKKIKGVYLFKIKGSDGSTKDWTINLKDNPSVSEGAVGKADCTITISDADYMAMTTGSANGQQLFMSGKLKIAGNMGLAMKLEELKKLSAAAKKGASAAGRVVFDSDVIFAGLGHTIKNNKDFAKKIGGVFQFKITKDGATKVWTLNLKNNVGLREGETEKPECTVTISDADYIGMTVGKLNPQQLFMQGKLKMAGNLGLAMKLDQLKKLSPEAGGGNRDGFKSDVVFVGMAAGLKNHAEVAKKVNGIFCFEITRNGGKDKKSWTVNLKDNIGVFENDNTKPDVTITVDDDDYMNMTTGKLNPQQMFMQGKLKMKGNMGLAMKLEQLKKLGPQMAGASATGAAAKGPYAMM